MGRTLGTLSAVLPARRNVQQTLHGVHPGFAGFSDALVAVFRLLFERNRALSFGKPEPRVNVPDDDES